MVKHLDGGSLPHSQMRKKFGKITLLSKKNPQHDEKSRRVLSFPIVSAFNMGRRV